MSIDLSKLTQNVNIFTFKNEKRYKLFSILQERLDNLTNDSYPFIIQFIKGNADTFFIDHQNTILFFKNVIISSKYNFKKFEIYLDICIFFSAEIKKNNITESELIAISLLYHNSIYYLFSHNFFSLKAIIDFSFLSEEIFVTFLPEIEEYDEEFARVRGDFLFNKNVQRPNLFKYYESVKNNKEDHKKYRNLNYHPSSLHKCIREDDLDTFQNYISRNNININYKFDYSYYDRVRTIDDTPSLIQVAAIYGSIKIFKYLFNMDTIIFNSNLLSYAYIGRNFEIIHLCEKKCSSKDVYFQSIILHDRELLTYFIENYGNFLKETDPDIVEALGEYEYIESEQPEYRALNYDALRDAILSFNYPIIHSSLRKIAYIVNRVEFKITYEYDRQFSILNDAEYDFELFKFLYDQRLIQLCSENDGQLYSEIKCGEFVLFENVRDYANDAFIYVFNDLIADINLIEVFNFCLQYNHDIGNYILDLQLESENYIGNMISSNLKSYIRLPDLILAVRFYNEDIVVKMIMLYGFIFEDIENLKKFAFNLPRYLSSKMIISLFARLRPLLSSDEMLVVTDIYVKAGISPLFDYFSQIPSPKVMDTKNFREEEELLDSQSGIL